MSGIHDKPILDEMMRVGGHVGVCDEIIKVSSKKRIKLGSAVSGKC